MSVEFERHRSAAAQGVVQHEVQRPQVGQFVPIHGAFADPGEVRFHALSRERFPEERILGFLERDHAAVGKVAVYGIYFDTGKSNIKPESDPSLSEIAKMLQANTNLKVYVVGHTDNVGSFDNNLKFPPYLNV